MLARSSTRTSALAYRSGVALALVALLSAAPACKGKEPRPALKVAAAADLGPAFKEIGEAWEKKSRQKVTFSFGSTGLLAKQISEGAPFDVFAAANVSFVDDVVKSGACFGDSKALYARGRIVVWTKKDAPAPPTTLADLKAPRFVKVAIANPGHAPYGRAAREALTKVGAWDAVSTKVVYGENVQQTLQFAQTGNVEAAIVALSLAMVSDGNVLPIDPALHAPLDQALVVCKGAPGGSREGDGRAFTAYVNSDDGRSIMKRFGFLLPGESVVSQGL